MKPRITVVTLGVGDLERSLRFYRDGLGLPTQGILGAEFEHGAVAFFDLQAGVKLAIWPRPSLSHDTGVSQAPPAATEFTLGHNVSSRAEVDAVMEEARRAGAVIARPATTPSGEATRGTSRTPTGICGRWCGTPSGRARSREGCRGAPVLGRGSPR